MKKKEIYQNIFKQASENLLKCTPGCKFYKMKDDYVCTIGGHHYTQIEMDIIIIISIMMNILIPTISVIFVCCRTNKISFFKNEYNVTNGFDIDSD